jgi:Arm domain-containing DNA-binding protein
MNVTSIVAPKAKTRAYEVSDSVARGLRIQIFPSGVQSYVFRYRHPVTKVSRKLTLGTLNIAAARKIAAAAQAEVDQGIDPIEAKYNARMPSYVSASSNSMG